MQKLFIHLILFAISFCYLAGASDKPNVLFIAVDDLNHWVGHLGRNNQAYTPNIDRLAKSGVSFSKSYCAAPACEPSRAATLGGKRPHKSGCYLNGDPWEEATKPGEGISAQFLKAGYYVAGAGKIYHGMEHHPEDWNEFMDMNIKKKNGNGVRKYDGFHNQKTHPNLKDEDIVDWHSVNYCIERLNRKHDKPFFIACGLYKPHLPFVAPRKYYERFPLESIQLPPYKENDNEDIPELGRESINQKDHDIMTENDQWKVAIQSYLATCSYADMNVGRLLDALENSPHKDNTIVVLWSDHGWSFGEKNHWRKFALWEEPTRSPYIWSYPGVTKEGIVCEQTVDLMSLYPTLMSLTGLPRPEHVDGLDITPLLKNPEMKWDHPALTSNGYNTHSIRKDQWRLIQYSDGELELYDHEKDPYEWTNLAKNPEYSAVIAKLKTYLPKENAEGLKKGKSGKKKKKKKNKQNQ